MKDIKEKLDKWVEGCDTIVTSPETVRKLQDQGLPFEVVPAKTIEELFEQKKLAAAEIIKRLPPIPDELDLPHAVKCLYQEILECILCGLNGAAITLCGNLIEFVLKHTTFICEQGGYQNYDAGKWDQFEEMDLSNAIGRAKKQCLLEAKMAKRLSEFREDIRNPYSHFNIKKITENVVAGKVKVVDLEDGSEEIRDIQAKDNPSIQALVKPWVDGQNVLNVFWFTDEVIRYLVKRLAQMEDNSAETTQLIEKINRFCDYFVGEVGSVPANASNLQKKLLFCCLIDTLGRAAFPLESSQHTRFVNLVNTFSCWELRKHVSMQQVLLRLAERKLTNNRLCEGLRQRISGWQTGTVMSAATDPQLDEMMSLADSDQEKKVIRECLHTELLYHYRNRLVHEYRESGYGFELSDDGDEPFYHSDSSGVWQLVYPVG